MPTAATPKKFAIIDGKSIFYRGYYAMPGLTTEDGTPTGGVYGFASVALELIKKLEPDYVAVAWDKSGTSIRRRKEIYPKYKAGRKTAPPDFYDQIPILHELLEAFGWPLYELDDYEADDIMGALAKQGEAQGIESMMISSDLDMLQLVDHDTHLYAIKRGFTDIERFDIKAFEEKYGIHVNQFLDLKALQGDSSDNIPGVPGIGEKTAVTLLQEYGTMDEIYLHLDDIRPTWQAKLEAGKESAYMSRRLSEIWCDAPVKLDLAVVDVRNLDVKKLRDYLKKLEFNSLLRRLPDFMKNEAQADGDDVDLAPSKIEEWSSAASTLVKMSKAVAVVLDGDDIVLSVENGVGYRAPLTAAEVLDSMPVIVHDAKALAEGLLRKDLPVNFTVEFDTRLAAFLLNSLRKSPSLEDATGWTETDDEGELKPMSAEQKLSALWSLYQSQHEKMANFPKLNRLAHEVDFPLQLLLARIEKRGVRLDTVNLQKMSSMLADRIKQVEQEIYSFVGYEFNVSSAPQLADALYKKLQLPTTGLKRSQRGYFSTSQSELDKLRGQHPIIEKIEQVRELLKLKNTYVDALPKLVDENSYLHTSLHQDVTATGRLSSTNPNLQNIPIRSELGQKIRESFIASDGKVLVNADYSQFELRLAAALSGDTNLIEDFQNDNIDIHTKTAAEAYGVALEDVTPTQRRHAKVINFGVLYGMSPHGLAAATGMSFSAAKAFIDRYFKIRQPIRDLIERTIEKAKSEGYVETYFGRRRPTPDVKASNFVVREAAKRAAANMPMQGTEADLMKMAMLKIDQEIPNATQILQIHDSILVECDPADAESVGAKMKEIMENIYPKIGVRLKVDIKSGTNWGEL